MKAHNILKWLFVIVIGLGIPQKGSSQTKNFIDQPYLETKATSDTLVTPDRIYVGILLRESDTKNKTSVEELEQRLLNILHALKIDKERQLSLKDASANFQSYFLKGKTVEKSKYYQLIVYDGTTLGKLLKALEKADIANTSLIKLEYSKMQELRLLLKSRAISRAKSQAQALVAPLNQRVGSALHIADRSYSQNRYDSYRATDQAEISVELKEDYEPISVDLSKIQVATEVSVKFKIED